MLNDLKDKATGLFNHYFSNDVSHRVNRFLDDYTHTLNCLKSEKEMEPTIETVRKTSSVLFGLGGVSTVATLGAVSLGIASAPVALTGLGVGAIVGMGGLVVKMISSSMQDSTHSMIQKLESDENRLFSSFKDLNVDTSLLDNLKKSIAQGNQEATFSIQDQIKKNSIQRPQ